MKFQSKNQRQVQLDELERLRKDFAELITFRNKISTQSRDTLPDIGPSEFHISEGMTKVIKNVEVAELK